MKKSVVKRFGSGKIKFVLVCCLHGDEPFGRKVFQYFTKRSSEFGSFKLILAHPEALSQKKRFIVSDLDRSFPGRRNGNVEEKLAYRIMREIPETAYIIDIHTTSADVHIVPFVSALNNHTRKLLNLCPAEHVVRVHKSMKDFSLIGQFEKGVSIEINRNYAKTNEALEKVVSIIDDLDKGKRKRKRERKVFQLEGEIDKKVKLPKKVQNFERVRGLGVYPVLYHKQLHPDVNAFVAKNFSSMII